MKIIRANDYADMSRKAANILSAQIILKPDCVLGLATGGTPVGAYQQLVEWYNKGDLDFSGVTTVNLDEYRGLPKDHPESYWSFMHRHLFDHVNINPARINLPDGTNPDADAACKTDGQRQQGCQKFQSFHKFSFLMPCRDAPQGAAPDAGWLEKTSTPSTGSGLPVPAESRGDQSSARPVVQ